MDSGKMLVFVIMILMMSSFVFAQSFASSEENIDDLDRRLTSEVVNEFADSSVDERNELLENTESELKRNSAVELLTEKIIKEKFETAKADGSFKFLVQKITSKFFENEVGIFGVDSYEEAKSTAEGFGFDLEASFETDPDQFSVKGFENLKFSENGENIVGDGNNWLNLDDLPLGLSEIEYKDGKFELSFRNGGKLTLEKGAVNDKGEVSAFKKLENSEGEKIPLRDISFPPSEEEGSVVLSEDRIKFEGESRMSLSEFDFFRDNDYSGESFVKVGKEGFIVKGVNFDREGYLKRSTSDKETIIAIGNFKEIVHRDSFLKVKEYYKDKPFLEILRDLNLKNEVGFSDPFEKVVKVVGFKDTTGNELELEFGNEGNLKRIREKGGQWLPLTLSLEDGGTPLADLYDKSSGFVKDRVINSGHYVGTTYEEIRDRFYSNPFISTEGNAFEIVDVQDNFVVMNGDNLFVGGEFDKGEGEVTLLRGLNSLQGVNAEVNVVNGKRTLGFANVDGVYSLNKDNIEGTYQYPIGKIETNDYVGRGTSFKSWTINNEGKLVRDDGRVMAGRSVSVLPYGGSIELSTEMKAEDFKDVVSSVNGEYNPLSNSFSPISPADNAVRTALGKEFTAKVEARVPVLEGVRVSNELKEEIIKDNVNNFISKLDPSNDERYGVIKNLVAKAKSEGKSESEASFFKDLTTSLVTQVSAGTDELNIGRMSLEIKNNPVKKKFTNYVYSSLNSRIATEYESYVQGTPSVSFYFGNQEVPITLNERQEEFFNDVLEVYWRAPDYSKGSILSPDGRITPTTTFKIPGIERPSFFWPPPHIGRLSKEIGIRTLGDRSGEFLKSHIYEYYGVKLKEE